MRFSLKLISILSLNIIIGAFPNPTLAVESAISTSTGDFWDTIATSTTEETIEQTDQSAPQRVLITEPTIRVGLYKTEKPVVFVSDAPYALYAGTQEIGTVPANEELTLTYAAGVYSATSASLSFSAPKYFRLVPPEFSNQFTLKNYSRLVSGRKKINFNAYRGVLEYRYSPKSKLPYVINELPLESYVAGIAESDDGVPTQYAKALLTAARTYAYVHLGKISDAHLFDVYATTQDQLYLGYNSEIFMPRIAAAAASTTGEMVTYKAAPVMTPYFGHSNGKTKNWAGKSRPWLVSVVAEHDKGLKLWGHGYGMSARDAMLHAKKDGWTYEQILRYYYSGTEVERIY
jgi:peptidoglycan hydrolase-like amidase